MGHYLPFKYVPGGVSAAKWCVFVNTTINSSSLKIAEIEMHTTPGGSNACSGGTVFSGSSGAHETGDLTGTKGNAFDGNLSTNWAVGWEQGCIGYDFGTPVNIVEISITSPDSSNLQSPKDFKIQYFNGSVWVDACYPIEQGTWGVSEKRTFTFATDDKSVIPSKRVWRIHFTDNKESSNYLIVNEIEMHTSHGGVNAMTINQYGYGSDAYIESLIGQNANDGDTTTATYWMTGNPPPWDFIYDFHSVKNINEVKIYYRSGNESRAPNNFNVDYWDGSTWQTAASFTAATWTSGTPQVFSW